MMSIFKRKKKIISDDTVTMSDEEIIKQLEDMLDYHKMLKNKYSDDPMFDSFTNARDVYSLEVAIGELKGKLDTEQKE